jgi:hypothetical protein
MINKTTINPREKGQSLLELAVSITVLFIMLAGVVDLGRMFFHYIAMRDAAQEAASYGAVFPTHCDQMRDRVDYAMNDGSGVLVTVLIDGVPCFDAAQATSPKISCYGAEIEVSLKDQNFPITMPFIGSILDSQTIPLETSVTGTVLRPPCE